MSERLSAHDRKHPLGTVEGVFALVLWSVYSVYVGLYYPDVLTSALVGGLFGLLACLALVFNFAYWRAAVVIASSVYLLLYVIRIVRMTAIPGDLSFLAALSFYYSASWHVTIGAFEEKGWVGGLMHGFLEFAMPVLVLALIIVSLISVRRNRRFSRIG
jgi:hypothetical protein